MFGGVSEGKFSRRHGNGNVKILSSEVFKFCTTHFYDNSFVTGYKIRHLVNTETKVNNNL